MKCSYVSSFIWTAFVAFLLSLVNTFYCSTRIFLINTKCVCPDRAPGWVTDRLTRKWMSSFRLWRRRLLCPPNPEYLKIHAAFAKVLHLCGAAEYIERIERGAETEGTLHLDGETDFASYLRSKIPIIVH
ncbi:hypothetical protein EDB83DRAFT_1478739 [Lactarius deliciosus]|nr:hypothetical protein EDB83DRAFT_1478739 [Lactarius deliciosus]